MTSWVQVTKDRARSNPGDGIYDIPVRETSPDPKQRPRNLRRSERPQSLCLARSYPLKMTGCGTYSSSFWDHLVLFGCEQFPFSHHLASWIGSHSALLEWGAFWNLTVSPRTNFPILPNLLQIPDLVKTRNLCRLPLSSYIIFMKIRIRNVVEQVQTWDSLMGSVPRFDSKRIDNKV